MLLNHWVCFLVNLMTIWQNSSKNRPSLLLVLWLMKIECSISRISSSLMVSPAMRDSFLSSSQLMQSSSSVSRCLKMARMPSLVFRSPILGDTISTNSSKLMGLFLILSPSMMLQMRLPFRESPSSSMILLISSGSMNPEWSASKVSKVFLRFSQSSGWSFSFQVSPEAPLPLVVADLAGLAGCLALLISYSIQQKQYLDRQFTDLNPPSHDVQSVSLRDVQAIPQ